MADRSLPDGAASPPASPARAPAGVGLAPSAPPAGAPDSPGPDDSVVRVLATPAALDLLAEIVARHGPVLFHQSGGCCDGSSPMCYPRGDFLVGDRDVLLGEIGGAPVYIGADQYELWRHTQLLIDVVPGRGGMFSLDNGTERRFLTRSRAFTGEEVCALPGR